MGRRKHDWQYGNNKPLPERDKPVEPKPKYKGIPITITRKDGTIEVIKESNNEGTNGKIEVG